MIRINSSVIVSLLLSTSIGSIYASIEDVATPSKNLRSPFEEESVEALNIMSKFYSWIKEHNKNYIDNEEEKMKRMKIWIHNHELIEKHNNQIPVPTYTLGHNKFSDLTIDEFQELYNLGQYNSNANINNDDDATAVSTGRKLQDVIDYNNVVLPDEVNWVKAGAVTPVKNQGACGSCWAFSTTGALEGAKFVKTGDLVPLSEQNLLDCDHTDLGCRGGLMDNAFKFDEKTGGLCSEEDYPYKAKQGKTCLTNCTDVPGTIVKTFVDVPKADVKALMAAISIQPVSIAVQANQFAFQFYKHGVINDDTCGKMGAIDHGVLAVGFGVDANSTLPYWHVKNSWGDSWGENGYLKISRKSKNQYGMCAILKMASLPIVE